MSYGRGFHCSSCTFQFYSGWSHHEGGSSFVCQSCGEKFIAKGGKSVWGPEPNERLRIYHWRRISKRKGAIWEPTELFVIATESKETDFFNKPLLQLQPPTLRCPACQVEEAVIQ